MCSGRVTWASEPLTGDELTAVSGESVEQEKWAIESWGTHFQGRRIHHFILRTVTFFPL